jgi:hypothetical protein
LGSLNETLASSTLMTALADTKKGGTTEMLSLGSLSRMFACMQERADLVLPRINLALSYSAKSSQELLNVV